MVAQRALQQRLGHTEESVSETLGRPAKSAYPRWIVVSSLALYCVAFWVLVWVAGNWGFELVRTAMAGGR